MHKVLLDNIINIVHQLQSHSISITEIRHLNVIQKDLQEMLFRKIPRLSKFLDRTLTKEQKINAKRYECKNCHTILSLAIEETEYLSCPICNAKDWLYYDDNARFKYRYN